MTVVVLGSAVDDGIVQRTSYRHCMGCLEVE